MNGAFCCVTQEPRGGYGNYDDFTYNYNYDDFDVTMPAAAGTAVQIEELQRRISELQQRLLQLQSAQVP